MDVKLCDNHGHIEGGLLLKKVFSSLRQIGCASKPRSMDAAYFRQRKYGVPVGLTPLAPIHVSHTKPIRGVGTSLG